MQENTNIPSEIGYMHTKIFTQIIMKGTTFQTGLFFRKVSNRPFAQA